MNPIFKQLLFKTERETRNEIHKSEFGFFVPGVNSGIYSPATLVVRANIKQKWAGIFRFSSAHVFSEIVLSPEQFDALFSEMTKIKKLRDGLKTK